MASFSALQEDNFQKKFGPKRIFPSDFLKIGLKNTLFTFGRKMVVCSLFILFVGTFSDFGLLFF